MQKTPLFQLIREELTRAFVFGIGFFIILALGFVGVAHAANGGIFGTILNNILASGNWETDITGTVKNAELLGGKSPDKFVTAKPLQSCGAGKCIVGFKLDGDVMCTP